MPNLKKPSKEMTIPRGKETRPEGRVYQRETYSKFNALKIVTETDHFREFIRAAGFVLLLLAALIITSLIDQGVLF